MKKTLLAVTAALAATAVPTIASAQLAFNAAVVTDYRYRGISQSKLKPAVSAGVDYAAGAFYVGAWASSIKWIDELGGDGNVEIDVYAGYKGEISKGLGFDVGVLTYVYPSNKLSPSANTTELYGALAFGPATLKYSHAVTNTFANADSKNSFYVDLSAGFDMGGGLMVTPHIGHQKIKGPNSSACSYTDYSVSLSKDFSGFVPSLMAVGTNAKDACYLVNGKDLGKASLVLGLKYNF
ncbi:MAG: TorF family putative porin [Pseudomonadota bacterium]